MAGLETSQAIYILPLFLVSFPIFSSCKVYLTVNGTDLSQILAYWEALLDEVVVLTRMRRHETFTTISNVVHFFAIPCFTWFCLAKSPLRRLEVKWNRMAAMVKRPNPAI